MKTFHFYLPFTSLLLLFVLNPLHSQQRIVNEKRPISSFSELEIKGAFKVELSQTMTDHLVLSAPEKLLPYLVTEVRNGTLVIQPKRTAYLKNLRWEEVNIIIPLVALTSISQMGSGEVYSQDLLRSKFLRLNQSGSGRVFLRIKTHKTTIKNSGSGLIQLSGDSQKLEANLSGSGQLKLKTLTAKEGVFNVSGSGSVQTLCTHKLSAKVSGSGKIFYHGEPKEVINTKVSGSGLIQLVIE